MGKDKKRKRKTGVRRRGKTSRKRPITHLGSVPVSADAAHAEAVATWCGRRVIKHIEADGTCELVIRQKATV